MKFCDALAIVFIILKLCNVISWSWGWVLAPIWIPALIMIIGIMAKENQKNKYNRR